MYLSCMPLLAVLRPSVLEFIFMFLVDGIVIFINQKIEGKIFQKLYPDTRSYFDGLDLNSLKTKSLETHINLFQSFSVFPKRRALYCALWAYVKLIPAMVIMVFLWEHQISNWQQFALVFGLCSINIVYFYGAIFIESHIFLSDLIKKIHAELNWEQVFKKAKVSNLTSEFEVQEGLTLLAMVLFMLAVQWAIITSEKFSGLNLNAMVALAGAVALTLFAHLWHLGRQFFLGGIKDLFKAMDDIDYKTPHIILPLHTTPLLARFEKSFNLLVERLKASEQEIASWVFQVVEKSRYHALGEMSALIAHDMTSSLHVIHFCVNELKSNPDQIRDPNYVLHLSTNVSRVLDLIDSLRARLKNSNVESLQTNFIDAHQHVLRILSTQYTANQFQSIEFNLDSNLRDLKLKLSRVDLIHILENLYRNSIENFLSHSVPNPKVSVQFSEPMLSNEIQFLISDNGTGLNESQFEELTAPVFTKTSSLQFAGLGLKLIRRLTEINGGTLSILPNEPDQQGTTFLLRLKSATIPTQVHAEAYQ